MVLISSLKSCVILCLSRVTVLSPTEGRRHWTAPSCNQQMSSRCAREDGLEQETEGPTGPEQGATARNRQESAARSWPPGSLNDTEAWNAVVCTRVARLVQSGSVACLAHQQTSAGAPEVELLSRCRRKRNRLPRAPRPVWAGLTLTRVFKLCGYNELFEQHLIRKRHSFREFSIHFNWLKKKGVVRGHRRPSWGEKKLLQTHTYALSCICCGLLGFVLFLFFSNIFFICSLR